MKNSMRKASPQSLRPVPRLVAVMSSRRLAINLFEGMQLVAASYTTVMEACETVRQRTSGLVLLLWVLDRTSQQAHGNIARVEW